MRSVLIFILLPFLFQAQDYTKLKIKKANQYFHFFQLSTPTDTIADNENDLFFMKISPAKLCHTKITVENGQLQRFQSDSIFKLVFFNNMNYQHFFSDTINTDHKPKNQKKSHGKGKEENCHKYNTEVNGAGNNTNSRYIIVKFVNPLNDSVYITNKFFYKP